jgi:hypothetical protein
MIVFLSFFLVLIATVCGQNQTPYVTEPLPEDALPYRLSIEVADFSLPVGLQAYAAAVYKGEWLIITGNTKGLHGFDPVSAFPVTSQNTVVYVVNPKKKKTYSRSLLDPTAHLSQIQIDRLSSADVLDYQDFTTNTLYLVGGYGMNTATGRKETFDSLTAVDVAALIQWVKKPSKSKTAAKCIRQVTHPLLQVTGGLMWQVNTHQPYLLVFGQNFEIPYQVPSDGLYTKQVRPIQIIDTGEKLFVQPYKQPIPVESYRRRDLNVVPIVKKAGRSYAYGFVALSGVFTPGVDGAVWTVPVEISQDGSTFMADPSNPNTFAQGLNNYSSPFFGLYSQKTHDMYTVLCGGLSYICPGGSPNPDPDVGFTNAISTVRIDAKGRYSQYLMSATYPSIPAPFGTPPGGDTLFGASSTFFLADGVPTYPNGVIAFDKLGSSPVLVGYIVGGIASALQETNFTTDSQSSAYIFKVMLNKVK